MYIITGDYHTHTCYSHGKGTIEDNVMAARRLGLKRIVISDHGFGHIGFGLKFRDVDKIQAEIRVLKGKYPEIDIQFGVEANLTGLNGSIDIPDNYMDKFDIILMGFHKAVMPASFKDFIQLFLNNALAKILPINRKRLRYQNTKAMINAMDRYPIKIITHPGAKINIDTRLLAKHAAQKGVALEINASHGFMTVECVKIAMEEGATFVINSDAHHPSRIGDFQKGIEIAGEAGLNPNQIINEVTFKHSL